MLYLITYYCTYGLFLVKNFGIYLHITLIFIHVFWDDFIILVLLSIFFFRVFWYYTISQDPMNVFDWFKTESFNLVINLE